MVLAANWHLTYESWLPVRKTYTHWQLYLAQKSCSVMLNRKTINFNGYTKEVLFSPTTEWLLSLDWCLSRGQFYFWHDFQDLKCWLIQRKIWLMPVPSWSWKSYNLFIISKTDYNFENCSLSALLQTYYLIVTCIPASLRS